VLLEGVDPAGNFVVDALCGAGEEPGVRGGGEETEVVAFLRRLPEQRGRLGDKGRREEEGGPGPVGAEHREERLEASDLLDLEGEGDPAGARDRANDLPPHPEPGEHDTEGDEGEVTAQKAEGQGQGGRVAQERAG